MHIRHLESIDFKKPTCMPLHELSSQSFFVTVFGSVACYLKLKKTFRKMRAGHRSRKHWDVVISWACGCLLERLPGSDDSFWRRAVGRYKLWGEVLSWVTCLTLCFSIVSCQKLNKTDFLAWNQVRLTFCCCWWALFQNIQGPIHCNSHSKKRCVTQPCEAYNEVNLIL